DATLLPWRSVRKNVELLAELEGASKADRSRLAADAVRLVGLQGFENHYPKALSGGMRMRTSVARALTMKPPLFLLDEPFAALAGASHRPGVRAAFRRGVPRAAEGVRMSEVGGAPSAPQLEAIARGGKISSLTVRRRGQSLLGGVGPPLGAFVIFVGIAYFFS